jgi:hypothetical protein
MRNRESTVLEARIEVVTTTFVASGRPVGIFDLDRLIETLNNSAISHHIELESPVVRPLYRAGDELHLDAALLVRREEIVFANFEGPSIPRETQPSTLEAPVLLLAPPFQIQGAASFAPGADTTQAMRPMLDGFFVVRRARVFDSDGSALGDGDQIIVNGAAVQMSSATARHIEAIMTPMPTNSRAPLAAIEDVAEAIRESAIRESRAA